ncbi:MAG: hypothetical protein AMXMBFR13_29200 [Phycisphaerae bacterium]
MSFKEYVPKEMTMQAPLEEGFASIDKNGTGRFHTEDLGLVGIGDLAVVMTDEITMRLALRAARQEEGRKALRVTMVHYGKKPRPDRRSIRLSGAIREMNLEPRSVAGRYKLTTKENLIIINLAEDESQAATDGE